jgi:FkbM family methyltransferase
MLASVKGEIKNYLTSRLKIDDAFSKIDNVFHPYGDSLWFAGPNLWEPSVALALKRLVRPGAVVFDVGANMGGLTTLISRLVGPRGIVCAFEASPRIIGHLQQNVIKQGASNVTVYDRAIYSKSNETVTIYDGDHLNDSLVVQGQNKTGRSVKTLALDDFCESSGLVPDVIKMDIEGAEYDALLGSLKILEKHRPHLILEQSPSDTRCFDLLVQQGYLAIDLTTLQQVSSYHHFAKEMGILNLLFLHTDTIRLTPYHLPISIVDVCNVKDLNFTKNHRGGGNLFRDFLGPRPLFN